MWTPATGMPRGQEIASRHRGSRRGRALPERLVADRLQHHLGGEVVAPVIHELEDLGERLGVDRRERNGSPARGARARSPRDDAAGAEQAVELGGGGERRVRDEAPVARGAVDDEGGERRRLDPLERGQPAVGHPLRVECGRVAGDPAGHAPDPLAPQDPDEALEIVRW